MKNWRHIFWDWNGTLLNDVEECIEIINKSLEKRDLKTLDRQEYLEKFQFPVVNYYKAIGFDFTKESFESAGQEYIDAYSEKMFDCSLHDAALEILSKIRSAGLEQYVLSALNADALEKCIEKFGLEKYFTRVRGLDDHYANSKIELGKTLLREAKIDPQKAVLIGDTLHDYETASAMGIDCVLVASGHNSSRRLKKCGVPVFDNLTELKNKLDVMLESASFDQA
ncbi:MAG: hypothetical protein PWR01_2107 [Clostridiales bacterium]|jgi:phosphoglycolate phosphatase|nr:hypothetical protein [Clostridiales bacterium]MDN5281034.1 hypothetical protein [Candidatus Ozemobacter sp.]